MELEHAMREEAGEPPSKENCDGKHDGHAPIITRKLAGQTVAPFLAKHIPEQYAPLGTQAGPTSSQAKPKDPNTKYCYRHRPDSKCRRTADEPSMENLQRVS
jgi:F-box and WD-40 domain protein MET30